MAQALTPEATVEYHARKRGGYYAYVTYSDGRVLALLVSEVANHMRTTDHFKWDATSTTMGSKGMGASSRTRIGAVRELVRRIEHRAAK